MAKSNLVEDVSQSGCTLLRYCIRALVTICEFQGSTVEEMVLGWLSLGMLEAQIDL